LCSLSYKIIIYTSSSDRMTIFERDIFHKIICPRYLRDYRSFVLVFSHPQREEWDKIRASKQLCNLVSHPNPFV